MIIYMSSISYFNYRGTDKISNSAVLYQYKYSNIVNHYHITNVLRVSIPLTDQISSKAFKTNYNQSIKTNFNQSIIKSCSLIVVFICKRSLDWGSQTVLDSLDYIAPSLSFSAYFFMTIMYLYCASYFLFLIVNTSQVIIKYKSFIKLITVTALYILPLTTILKRSLTGLFIL